MFNSVSLPWLGVFKCLKSEFLHWLGAFKSEMMKSCDGRTQPFIVKDGINDQSINQLNAIEHNISDGRTHNIALPSLGSCQYIGIMEDISMNF